MTGNLKSQIPDCRGHDCAGRTSSPARSPGRDRGCCVTSGALSPPPVWCAPTVTRRVSAATPVTSPSSVTRTPPLRCVLVAFYLGCLLCWLPMLMLAMLPPLWIQCFRNVLRAVLSFCRCQAPAVACARRWRAPPSLLRWLLRGSPLIASAAGVCCRTRLTASPARRPAPICWVSPLAPTRTTPIPPALRVRRYLTRCARVLLQSQRTKPTLRWKRGPDARCSAGTLGPGMNMCL